MSTDYINFVRSQLKPRSAVMHTKTTLHQKTPDFDLVQYSLKCDIICYSQFANTDDCIDLSNTFNKSNDKTVKFVQMEQLGLHLTIEIKRRCLHNSNKIPPVHKTKMP